MRFRFAVLLLLFAAPALAKKPAAPPPAVDIALHRQSGTVTYQRNAAADPERVTATHVVGRDAIVTTGPSSLGVLVYPDSSHVALGAGTTVQVGAFASAAGSRVSTTIRIPPTGGVLRFDVNHAASGESDFTFLTPLATVTVRGTSALLSHGIGGDTLTCLVCEAGDVVARLGGHDYALLSGETMRIAPTGRVRIERTSDDVLATFASAGLSLRPPPAPSPSPSPHRFRLPKIKL